MWNKYSTTWKFLGTFNSRPKNLNILATRSSRRNTWSLHIFGCLFIFLLALPIVQPTRSLVSIISESFRSSVGYFPYLGLHFDWNQKHIDQARAEQSIELQISWKLSPLLCLPIQCLLVKSATCFQIFRYLQCQSNSQAGS